MAPCLRSILQPHTTQYKWLVKTINMIKLARYLKTMSTISNYMCIMSLCWMICNLHQKPCKVHALDGHQKVSPLGSQDMFQAIKKYITMCLANRYNRTTKGHFTHPPSAVTTKLWEPKRKWVKVVPNHLQNHAVWSRILQCSVKSYVTGPSTKCYFHESLFM